MTVKIQTASAYGNNLENAEIEIICTSQLVDGYIALMPLKAVEGTTKRKADTAYVMSHEAGLDIATVLLAEIIGSSNVEVLDRLMDKIRFDAQRIRDHLAKQN